MRGNFLLLSLLISLVAHGCSSDSEKPKKAVEVQPSTQISTITTKRVCVVIDGSNSLNEAACTKISNEVLRIFDALTEYQELRVFSTSEGTKTQPLFIWKKTSPTKPSLEKKYKDEIVPATKKALTDVVTKICSNANNGSYILHGIQSVYSNLQGTEKANQNMLLILSDMLECSPQYYGCSEQQNGFEKMSLKLSTTNLSSACPLATEIPIENVFTCYISMNDDKRYIQLSSSEECKEFWDSAFKEMGYSTGPPNGTDIGGFISKIRR